MVDFNKPLRTRDGRAVQLVSTDMTPELWDFTRHQLGNVSKFEDTIAAIVDGELLGFKPGGRFFTSEPDGLDLVNVLQRTSEFRLFHSRGEGGNSQTRSLGRFTWHSLETVPNSAKYEGVLEIIREDGKLVDVIFHAPEG